MIYPFEVALPSGLSFWVRELNTAEQKAIIKSILVTQNQNHQTEFLKSFRKIISNCISNPDDLNSITIIEYLLLCLKIAAVSFGANKSIFYNDTDPQTNEPIQVKYDFNIPTLIHKIYELSTLHSFVPVILENKTTDLIFRLGWPKLSHEEEFYNIKIEEKDFLSKSLDILGFFIHSINHNPTEPNIVEQIPANISSQISNQVFASLNVLSSHNLFPVENVKFRLQLLNGGYSHLLQLVFNENIHQIYQEILVLAQSAKLDPNYIETIPEVERKLFINLLKAQSQEKKNQENEKESTPIPLENQHA